jgi:ABC-type anion transport system duplicated permease subunit
MSQGYRVVGSHLVYVPASRMTLFGKIEVIIVGAAKPFAGWNVPGSMADGYLYIIDRAN